MKNDKATKETRRRRYLKLPHISTAGRFSINPLSVPHIRIKWYLNGGLREATDKEAKP